MQLGNIGAKPIPVSNKPQRATTEGNGNINRIAPTAAIDSPKRMRVLSEYSNVRKPLMKRPSIIPPKYNEIQSEAVEGVTPLVLIRKLAPQVPIMFSIPQ